MTAPARRSEPAPASGRRAVAGDAERWVTGLLRVLGSQRQGCKWQCPAHGLSGDHSVSLAVTTGTDGRVLIFDHGGCDWRDILRVLRLSSLALIEAPPITPAEHARRHLPSLRFPPPRTRTGGSHAERGFRFQSEHPYGKDVWLIRMRHPSGAKEVMWESLNSRGERVPGLLGRRTSDLPLYGEREVLMAVAAGEVVLLVESESSADALRSAGWYATTWAGGAAAPPLGRLRRVLSVTDPAGATDTYDRLVVIPDYDAAGLGCLHALNDAGLLLNLVHGTPGEDARDLLARVGRKTFAALIADELNRHKHPSMKSSA